MQQGTKITLANNEYELIELISCGKQTVVWRARHCSSGSFVAFKTIRVEANKKPLSRFLIQSHSKYLQQDISFLSILQQAENHFIAPHLVSGFIQVGTNTLPVLITPIYKNSVSALITQESPNLISLLKITWQLVVALKYVHQQKNDKNDVLVFQALSLNVLGLDESSDLKVLPYFINEKFEGVFEARNINLVDYIAPEQCGYIDGYPSEPLLIKPYSNIYSLGLIIYFLFLRDLPKAHQQLIDKTKISQSYKNNLELDNSNNFLDKAVDRFDELLGGMNAEDEKRLCQSFQFKLIECRFNSQQHSFRKTQENYYDVLDHIRDIAASFSGFVKQLTHPDYSKRPTAQEAFIWINQVFNLIGVPPPAEPSSDSKIVAANDTLIVNKSDYSNQPVANKSKEQHKWWVLSTALILTSVLGLQFSNIKLWSASGIAQEKSPVLDNDINNIAPIKTIDYLSILLKGAANEQQKVWVELNKNKLAKPFYQKVINEYEQQINKWINGSDERDWKRAIVGLERSASIDNENALLWLAYSYQKGRGVDKNWKKAWSYYQQAIDKNGSTIARQQQAFLERNAYQLLSSLNTSHNERELAYQVVATRATTTERGDVAHLWMFERFRFGDGITPDINEAQYWLKRYLE